MSEEVREERPGEEGKRGLGQVSAERFVGEGLVVGGVEAAVEVGEGVHIHASHREDETRGERRRRATPHSLGEPDLFSESIEGLGVEHALEKTGDASTFRFVQQGPP